MTNWIMQSLQTHGPLTVFIGVIIESIIVPIPSPLIIMGAGAILIQPGLHIAEAVWPIILKIVLPGAIASTLGAYFTFGISFWGGKPMIDKFQWLLGFKWENILKMEQQISGRVSLMIFVLRAIPIVPLSLISAAAGVIRIPIWQFTLWTFLGSLPRCLLLGILGYLTRDSYEGLAGKLNHFEALSSILIVIFAFAIIIWLRAKMRSKI